VQIAATPKTRLFIPDALIANSELSLTGEQANYVARVLRLKVGGALFMFDGNGGKYGAVIKSFSKNRVVVTIGEHHDEEIESPLAIRLVQGISRAGRMDIVVQKATELGVRRISPVITEFSVVKLAGDRAVKRHEHWRKISQSACEQCGRNSLPAIDGPQDLRIWLDNRKSDGATRILLDPQSRTSVSMLQAPKARVDLLVGPEGGLSEAERSQCEESGFTPVSLGPRVLRTETAALAGITVLQTLWGDFR